MGGFKPSRSDIDSSTSVGSDITLDSHQFTGSVDITGSLTLNGAYVTTGGGGGGGAVSSYTNSGDNRIITSVNSNTINGEANLTFDGSDLVVAAGDVSASAGVLSSSAGVFFAGNMTGSGHIAIGKIGVGPGGDTIAADVGRTATLFVDGEARFQGSVNSSHIPIAGGTENIFLRPGTNSGDVIIADTAATMNVGVGVTSPQAKLHVSSSGTEPLFRVDHSTQAGSKPILFVTGSGLVGIGTAAPREDSGNTNRLHILAEEGADQGQDPVDNMALMLENNGHVGIQFMTPVGQSGQLVWGTSASNARARFYYNDNVGRFIYEDGGYGDSEIFTILKAGDSINMGLKNSGHMGTNKAALHISSSTDGTDVGGPVLLRVDHADQPGGEPTLFVTGSGRVGIGNAEPAHTLDIRGGAGLSGSLEFSGTLTTTSLSTLVGTMGLVNVDRAATTIDVTGQATNAQYVFGIANGTVVGQRKDIFMKIAADGTIDGSNSINLTGSNIASGQSGASNGSLQLTGTDGGGGSQFAQPQGGASLMWDGTDWLVLSINGLSHAGF